MSNKKSLITFCEIIIGAFRVDLIHKSYINKQIMSLDLGLFLSRSIGMRSRSLILKNFNRVKSQNQTTNLWSDLKSISAFLTCSASICDGCDFLCPRSQLVCKRSFIILTNRWTDFLLCGQFFEERMSIKLLLYRLRLLKSTSD